MVIDMNDKQLATLAQLQAFLDGTTAVDFAVAPKKAFTTFAHSAAPEQPVDFCRNRREFKSPQAETMIDFHARPTNDR